MKKILSFVLVIIIAFGGITMYNNEEVKAENKEIYDIGCIDYYIYLGGNITINATFYDENYNKINNPNFSNWIIKWEKYNKNTKENEFYSNTTTLTIKNATKDDFTNYQITLINKDPRINPISTYFTLNEISKEEYEKTTTQSETEEPTTKEKSEGKNLASVYDTKIKLNKTEYGYTGKEIKPLVNIYSESLDGEENYSKLDPKYYTVTYKNNIKPGTASVIISGKSPYYGSRTLTFTIKLNNVKLSKVQVKNKKKIKITCKKVKCDGYQFRYKKSTQKLNKSASKKGWKTKTSKKNIFITKKLKKGNYFVQVRSYVKNGNKKIYSSYTSRDQMTVVGKSTKIEKSRFYVKASFNGKECICYAPKYASKKIKEKYTWGWVRSTNALREKTSPYMTKYIRWKIASKDGNKLLYNCLADVKGNIIEEKYY